MKLHAMLRLIAGVFILISLALSHWVHPNWVYLSIVIGLNLIQSAFTLWCPMISILQKLGVEE
ncbi:DUF2892 domain-containing protein [Paraglaciecola sp. 2405UD69-4]|uniref:YgaP family membrane protein n=1 Tax=Paraglaciecola sp. 2405UD69-4 TaxID=3391836 RepID=UPI0039C8CCFD